MIKEGVRLHESTAWVVAMPIIREIYRDFGVPCVITSGVDGEHREDSLHYSGQAFDFRTRNVPAADLSHLVAEITRALGDEFDVVLEETHLHVEWDPA